MRSLLDVNVLIALLDADHAFHSEAMAWFGRHARDGWASCPITQNGCIRVMSHPGYPNPAPVNVLGERLRDACRNPVHQFWADDVSLLDDRLIDSSRIHGPRQLTDLYLLALAVKHQGRLVTFDASIPLDVVHAAKPQHLVKL